MRLLLDHLIKQISFSVSLNILNSLNSLLGASHLVCYISVHIRFDLERYLLNIFYPLDELIHVSCPFDDRMDEILYGLGTITFYSGFTYEIGFHCALRVCEILNFISQNFCKI